MSKSAGLPDCKEYLLDLCDDVALSQNAIRERLEVKGDYEGAMNDIIQRLTFNRFERDFERSFRIPEEIGGAVTLLPKAFEEKVTGRGRANAFFRAIPAGRRYLLKLHGNIDNAAERVLNQHEATKGTSI